jgi:hypothetical protein
MRGELKQNDDRWDDQALVKVERMGKMIRFGKFGKYRCLEYNQMIYFCCLF